MKKFKFIRCEKRYTTEKINVDAIEAIIAGFFDDVRDNVPFWASWIKNTKSESISGNITFIYKDEGKIYMMDLFEDDENAPEFIIDQERLIYLLEKWDEFYKKRAPKIILTFDDDYNFLGIYAEE